MTGATRGGGAAHEGEMLPLPSDSTGESALRSREELLKRQAVALTVDRMISAIGHELNQPLNVISMASFNGTRMASRSTTTAPDFERRFQVIQDETRRAGALVHTAMQLTAGAITGAAGQDPCPVRVLQDVMMPRFRRRGISLSVRSAIPQTVRPDRWLMMFVVLCGLERLEEDRSVTIDDQVVKADLYCESGADNRELTVGLQSTALLGRSTSEQQSPFPAMLETLAEVCGGQVIDEPGHWTACFAAAALS